MHPEENVQWLLWKPLSRDHNDCFDNYRLDRLHFYHVETGDRLVNISNGLLYVKAGMIVGNFLKPASEGIQSGRRTSVIIDS